MLTLKFFYTAMNFKVHLQIRQRFKSLITVMTNMRFYIAMYRYMLNEIRSISILNIQVLTILKIFYFAFFVKSRSKIIYIIICAWSEMMHFDKHSLLRYLNFVIFVKKTCTYTYLFFSNILKNVLFVKSWNLHTCV